MKRLLLLLFVTTQVALGQTDDSTAVGTLPTKTNFKFGLITELDIAFASGYGNLPSYRSFLKANQVGSPPGANSYINLGFGGRFNRLKIMTQVGVSALFSTTPSEPSSTSLVSRQLNAGYLGAMIGYDVVNARNRRVYINAGIGGFGYEFSIYRQTTQPVSFQNMLQQTPSVSVPSLLLTNTYWDVSVEYCQREKRRRSAQTVLRVGYRRGIRPEPFTSDAFQLTNAPTDRISQVYIQAGYCFSSNYTKLGKR